MKDVANIVQCRLSVHVAGIQHPFGLLEITTPPSIGTLCKASGIYRDRCINYSCETEDTHLTDQDTGDCPKGVSYNRNFEIHITTPAMLNHDHQRLIIIKIKGYTTPIFH